MDEQTYKAWRALQLRVARGEVLSAEEQAIYEAGERQLDAEDPPVGDVRELLRLKSRLAALEKEQSKLLDRKAQLDAEIADLEAHLSPQTRELLEIRD